MGVFEKIVRSARPGPAVHLRAQGYGAGEEQDFLRDVIGLANADCEGGRLIVMGVAPTPSGGRRFMAAHPAGHDRFDYPALVNDCIEPALEVVYREVDVDDAAVGVLHIQLCHDLPYLMRIDHSVNLRRGDGFSRVGGKAVKMGRSHLERIFARKFRARAPARRIEIGFAGDFIVKDWQVPTVDPSQRPSELARAKMAQFMNAQESASGTGSTTVVERLTHARLYGSDRPYEKRSRAQLMGEIAEVGDELWNDDQYFLFGSHGQDLDIVILNQGDDALVDIKFVLSIPRVAGLYIANSDVPPLAAAPGDPSVTSNNKSIRISTAVAQVQAGSPVSIFASAARFCASDELAGTRVPVEYALTAGNLAAPVVGRLHFSF